MAALDFLQNNQIDVALLDIEMKNMNGLELANRAIDIQAQMEIVFVTAYNQMLWKLFV
jgi:two-component SAPR family response regulator